MNTLTLRYIENSRQRQTYLRHQLMQRAGIQDVSFCFRPPAYPAFKAGVVNDTGPV